MSVWNMMTVQTARPYQIAVGDGLLAGAGRLAREVSGGQRALIVTDSNVAPLYAGDASASFRAAGFETAVFEFPAGEQSKRLDIISAIYGRLADLRVSRSDLLVALGGGVTGDMTGFAAATWLRGVDFVQVPTTLLAQVDSSVGGKTGVDIPEGKNLVGAFWQPVRVIADTAALDTLPAPVFIDGAAEVVKTAAIRDEGLFAALESGAALKPAARGETISRCIAIKKGVVERDERETGERKLLNFGHTLGHALERFYGYTGLTHGSAVAVGMAWLTRASEQRGMTKPGTAGRLRGLLKSLGLPVDDPAPLREILPAVTMDKKRAGSAIDLVLLHRVGDAFVHRISVDELPAFLGLDGEGRP